MEVGLKSQRLAASASPRAHASIEDDETTCDAFFDGRLSLRQPKRGLRAGMDALLLAASVPTPRGCHSAKADGPTVLDLGTGCGIAALAVATRIPSARVLGVELIPALTALARRNAQANAVADRATFIVGEISAAPAAWETDLSALCGWFDRPGRGGHVDHVIANPPYHAHGTARPSPDPLRAAATVLGPAGLDPWAACAARWLKPGGRLTLVNRAAALPAMLAALTPRFGSFIIAPVHTRLRGASPDTRRDTGTVRDQSSHQDLEPGQHTGLRVRSNTDTDSSARENAAAGLPGGAAELILVRATLGGAAPLRLLAGISAHTTDGAASPVLTGIARHAAALSLE
ncbi:MAG: methyltransferase domain-containing protein [Pseudomonadota bacterium]